MFLKKPEEKNLKEITTDEFEIQLMKLIRKDVQPERSKREDITCKNCGFIRKDIETRFKFCSCDDAVL